MWQYIWITSCVKPCKCKNYIMVGERKWTSFKYDKFTFSLWAGVSNCQRALRSKANSNLGMSLDDLENKWVVETLKNYQHFFGWYWENLNLGMPVWMTCWGWRMTCLRESGKQQQVLRWLCTLPPYFVVYCTSTNSSTFWYTLLWRWWGMA